MKRYIKGYYCDDKKTLEIISKESNRVILEMLRKSFPVGLSAAELVKKTERPETTVYAQLKELEKGEIIKKIPRVRAKPGKLSHGSKNQDRAQRYVLSTRLATLRVTQNFQNTFNELVDKEEREDLHSTLIPFLDRFIRKVSESKDKKIRDIAPTTRTDHCCKSCGISHEIEEFIEAISVMLVTSMYGRKQFYDLLKKYQCITEEQYKESITELEEKQEEEEF